MQYNKTATETTATTTTKENHHEDLTLCWYDGGQFFCCLIGKKCQTEEKNFLFVHNCSESCKKKIMEKILEYKLGGVWKMHRTVRKKDGGNFFFYMKIMFQRIEKKKR